MPELAPLDETDHAILALLQKDARQPAAAIASCVGLSAAAVRRRIDRLRDLEVIVGFTAVLDHPKVAPAVEAYVELTFTTPDIQEELEALMKDRTEVREASILAGDPDAIVRLRVRGFDELRDVVTALRNTTGVTGSKTLVALKRVRHVSQETDAKHGPRK